uniref:Uncharacterized protein n=1 Tax=Hyaloperonospora arabidopsidis (strain Emoy2) TaxID=559515 RepID=M4BAZ3_HYAAE
MSITSTSSRDNPLALATPTDRPTETASIIKVQARLLHDIDLASVPQIRQLVMDATNAVVEASAMIANFPIEMQASLADANAVTGEDATSMITTATSSQVGMLTHHNQELHRLPQTFQHDVTTVRDQRNALQETVTQLVKNRSKLTEDLAKQRIQFTTELDRRTTKVTSTSAVLSERVRTLQEQDEQVEIQREITINNCRAEHQVVVERLHQDITCLTQRNDRLQAEHINIVVALKEQQCANLLKIRWRERFKPNKKLEINYKHQLNTIL